MYNMKDLFDKRSVVGIKLEKIITERGITKGQISEQVGISRPTLNKLLDGTLTSKTNYEKHVSKVMKYLSVSADMLLGNIKNHHIRTREIRNLMKINSSKIAQATGIPITRLMEIEAGEEATIAELRDIALCLSVSVNCLLGKNFFESQIGTMDLYVGENSQGYSGQWGDIGVQPRNYKHFFWFPITENTREMIYRMMTCKRLVVPCMNNKILILNMENINEIIMLDDACDQPSGVNWKSGEEFEELPLVIYEAMEDYYDDKAGENGLLSPGLYKIIDKLVEEKKWSEDKIYELMNLSKVYYTDEEVRYVNIDFLQSSTIPEEIYNIYSFEEAEFAEEILYGIDNESGERVFNMKNIAMMELPLLRVEGAISELMKDEEIEDE